MKPRLVCWYSHGAASLIAAKKAIEMQPELYPDHQIVVACIHLENEYHEPEREVSVVEFLGVPITYLRDEKYDANVDVVIKKTRYMSGVRGARCTKELKKQVRYDWQRHDDVHVFGMTNEEVSRIDNLLDSEPEIEIFAPLVALDISKKDCFLEMTSAGLELPMMYKLGFMNNNCIGCLKATGAGYWNKIRKLFPKVFWFRAKQEELLGVALITMGEAKFNRLYPDTVKKMKADGQYRVKSNKTKVKRKNKDSGILEWTGKYRESRNLFVPLRYLPEGAGSHKDLDIGDCGFFCERKG